LAGLSLFFAISAMLRKPVEVTLKFLIAEAMLENVDLELGIFLSFPSF